MNFCITINRVLMNILKKEMHKCYCGMPIVTSKSGNATVLLVAVSCF